MPENISILLVEDDEVDVEAVKRQFKKHDIQNPVYHAISGVEALNILRGDDEKEKLARPYIMLIDINMPRMSGLDLLKEVRSDKSLKESIAFILTTSSRDTDIAAAYELNAAGYFLKEDVHELVDILSHYQQANKFPDSFGCEH